MPRYRLHTKFGTLAARGLYHLPFLKLLGGGRDDHPMLPAGTFARDSDLVNSGWTNAREGIEGIYISQADFQEFPRTKYCGCCGPDGGMQNVLDPQNMEPVAYEFADCYSSHYIHFKPGDYELTEESAEQPVCLVGCVSLNKQTWLVGAACGRNSREAGKRLAQDCQKYLRLEASYSSHNRQIARLPVETREASLYLRRFKKTEKPQWLFLKY